MQIGKQPGEERVVRKRHTGKDQDSKNDKGNIWGIVKRGKRIVLEKTEGYQPEKT